MNTRTSAATIARWSRPCTARSIRLAAAKPSHTHQMTAATGERKTWMSGAAGAVAGLSSLTGVARLADERGQHPDAVADRPLCDVEGRLVQVARGQCGGRAGTEPGHGPGHPLQVPGEVLAAQALRRVLH